MKTLAKNKSMLAVIALFILMIFLYNLFFKPETVSIPSALSASSVGDDLLKIHRTLQGVTLDQTLFSARGYLFLTDFSTNIPPQTVGRSNPFDIIGRD